MSWGAPRLQWLNTTEVQLNQNLEKLLDSNPIISSKQTNRTTGNKNLREWVKNKILTEFIRFHLKAKTYSSDNLFQQKLETLITELLAKSHYLFMLRQAPRQNFNVIEKQFWFPASYYVCGWKMEEGTLKYFKMHFSERNFFNKEFYDFGAGSRHPALVIKCFSQNFFCLIPFSNEIEYGGQYKRMVVQFRDGNEEYQNAIYGYHFKASASMLNGKKDLKGMKILDTDFNSIVNEVKQISKDLI